MSTDIEAMTRVVPSRAVSSPVSSSSVNLLRATCHLRPLKTAEGTRRCHSGLSGEPCAKAAPAVALEQREGRSLHRATSGATLARLAVVLGGHPQRGGGVSRSLASDHRTRPPASHFQGFPWNSSCRTSLRRAPYHSFPAHCPVFSRTRRILRGFCSARHPADIRCIGGLLREPQDLVEHRIGALALPIEGLKLRLRQLDEVEEHRADEIVDLA